MYVWSVSTKFFLRVYLRKTKVLLMHAKEILHYIQTSFGARGGTRTRTASLPEDFKSSMSTIPSPGQIVKARLRHERLRRDAICIVVCTPYKYAETWARIELAYSSFAENRLTTWPPGHYVLFYEEDSSVPNCCSSSYRILSIF